MPHLYDKETGLCVVCNRLEIAAIKEGKKFKRQNYDIRKQAIDNVTNKNDPNYRKIIDRHYVKYRDSLDESSKRNEPTYKRPTFTKQLPVEKIGMDDLFQNEDEEVRKIEIQDAYYDALTNFSRKNKNEFRDTLRKVNLANVSRLNSIKPNTIKTEQNFSSNPRKVSVVQPKPKKSVINNEELSVVPYENNNQLKSFYTRSMDNMNNYEVPAIRRGAKSNANFYLSEDNLGPANGSVYPKKKKKIVIHHHYEDDDFDNDDYYDLKSLKLQDSPRSILYQNQSNRFY